MTLLSLLDNTPHGMVWSIGLFLGILGTWFLYQALLPKPIPGIPYNVESTKRLFGDAPDMAREIKNTGGEFNAWMAKQVMKLNSPVCQIFVRPFSKPWVLVADFREAEDILMRRAEFDKPTFLIDGMLSLGDFAARFRTNEAFRARRHLKHDLMTPTFLHGFIGPHVHSTGTQLLKIMERKIELAAGRPFSIKQDYENTALDIVTNYEFGDTINISALGPTMELFDRMTLQEVPAGSLDEPVEFPHPELDSFLVAVDQAPLVLEKTTNSWAPHLSHWMWTQQGWYKKIFDHKSKDIPVLISKAVENVHNGHVNSALEHVIMREAALAEKESRAPRYSEKWLIDEAFGDLVASHHTNSGAMSWISKYLTGHPLVQSKLRAHLYSEMSDAATEKRLPTFEEIRRAKVPYFEAIMAEAQRLNPFSMVREATCDTEILGHKIPRGCQVFMVNGGPGYLSPSLPVNEELRSPSCREAKSRGTWDEKKDMSLFDPERWLVKTASGQMEFNAVAGPQLGFGAGVRQCWGRRMAQLQVKVIMVLMVWSLEFLEIPESLGSYAGRDGISRQPQQVFVRLRKLMNS